VARQDDEVKRDFESVEQLRLAIAGGVLAAILEAERDR
jgi:hypothetical protein